MIEIRANISDREALDGFRLAPDAMKRQVGAKLRRAAEEVAREAKQAAPKAFSTLTNSIRAQRESVLEYRVAPGVEYAAYVEQGTRRGGFPPKQSMLDWIKTKGITPRDPDMDQEDLAFVISRSIASRGTPPQPFMAPTAARMESRVFSLIRAGVDAGLQEAGFR